MKRLVMTAVGILLWTQMAAAQIGVPLTAVSERAHATANAGAFVLTTGEDWSGASLGGTLLYNLHPKLSVFGAYDHGFPVNDLDDPLNVWRAMASARIHPSAFVGFGYAWFGDEVDGGLVQLTIYKPVMRRLDLAGSYSHVFPRGLEVADFEYVKVGLNYHLLGKE